MGYSGKFARGLFYSDDCRTTNRVQHRLAAGEGVYEYPRYLFVNRSDDILRLRGEWALRLSAGESRWTHLVCADIVGCHAAGGHLGSRGGPAL